MKIDYLDPELNYHLVSFDFLILEFCKPPFPDNIFTFPKVHNFCTVKKKGQTCKESLYFSKMFRLFDCFEKSPNFLKFLLKKKFPSFSKKIKTFC